MGLGEGGLALAVVAQEDIRVGVGVEANVREVAKPRDRELGDANGGVGHGFPRCARALATIDILNFLTKDEVRDTGVVDNQIKKAKALIYKNAKYVSP